MEQRGLIADALTGQVRHFLAQACQYAQSHIDDPESWSADTSAREERLQVVSFQAACFLARHTRGGGEGVDWDVILKELVEHPMKTEAEWLGILHQKAELYGGWAMPAPSAESTLSP